MHRMLHLHNCCLLFDGNAEQASPDSTPATAWAVAQPATRNPVARLVQTTFKEEFRCLQGESKAYEGVLDVDREHR